MAITGPASQPGRLIGIDALRGVAAVAVCLFHWEHIAFGTANPDQIFRLGLLGVELFFTISGFAILMVAERTRSIRRFAISRAVRLYPAYLASVLLTAVYVLWVGKYGLPAVLVNLTMLQSFVGVPNIANPYWTLAFEIAFYAMAAAVLLCGALRHLEALALAWLAVAVCYRFGVPDAMAFDASRPWHQIGYIAVMPQFAPFFVLGLMTYRLHRGTLGWVGGAAIAAAVAAAAFGRGDFAGVSGPTYAAFAGLAALAVWRAASLGTRALPLRLVAWLGLVSFPLYLVHCTVANLCVTAGERWGLGASAAVGLSIPLALALAAALHHGLEQPCIAAARRAFDGLGEDRSGYGRLGSAWAEPAGSNAAPYP